MATGVATAKENDVIPNYVIYCEGSNYQGRHDALASGWIEVICTTDSAKSFSGKAFQCTKCYMVIATENEPKYGIGKYAEWGAGEPIGNFSYMRVSTVRSKAATTLPTYRFRYI